MDLRGISVQRLEVFIASIVLVFSLGFIFEVPFSLAEILLPLWELMFLLAPGSLALVVLIDGSTHGYRILAPYFGKETARKHGDLALTRIVASLGLLVLAAYTMYWVIGSFYVMYIASVGGIPPSIVALLFGGILSIAVLLKVGFFTLFPAGPMVKMQEIRNAGIDEKHSSNQS